MAADAGAAVAEQAAGFSDLPDVNVWLALAAEEHQHHEQARAYWNEAAAARLLFCRVTMLGLVRLLVQPKVMGRGVLDLRRALQVYQGFAETACVGWQEEPNTCGDHLAAFLIKNPPARFLTDAYLAAVAISANARLVSFDSDFRRFAGLRLLQLPTSQPMTP